MQAKVPEGYEDIVSAATVSAIAGKQLAREIIQDTSVKQRELEMVRNASVSVGALKSDSRVGTTSGTGQHYVKKSTALKAIVTQASRAKSTPGRGSDDDDDGETSVTVDERGVPYGRLPAQEEGPSRKRKKTPAAASAKSSLPRTASQAVEDNTAFEVYLDAQDRKVRRLAHRGVFGVEGKTVTNAQTPYAEKLGRPLSNDAARAPRKDAAVRGDSALPAEYPSLMDVEDAGLRARPPYSELHVDPRDPLAGTVANSGFPPGLFARPLGGAGSAVDKEILRGGARPIERAQIDYLLDDAHYLATRAEILRTRQRAGAFQGAVNSHMATDSIMTREVHDPEVWKLVDAESYDDEHHARRFLKAAPATQAAAVESCLSRDDMLTAAAAAEGLAESYARFYADDCPRRSRIPAIGDAIDKGLQAARSAAGLTGDGNGAFADVVAAIERELSDSPQLVHGLDVYSLQQKAVGPVERLSAPERSPASMRGEEAARVRAELRAAVLENVQSAVVRALADHDAETASRGGLNFRDRYNATAVARDAALSQPREIPVITMEYFVERTRDRYLAHEFRIRQCVNAGQCIANQLPRVHTQVFPADEQLPGPAACGLEPAAKGYARWPTGVAYYDLPHMTALNMQMPRAPMKGYIAPEALYEHEYQEAMAMPSGTTYMGTGPTPRPCFMCMILDVNRAYCHARNQATGVSSQDGRIQPLNPFRFADGTFAGEACLANTDNEGLPTGIYGCFPRYILGCIHLQSEMCTGSDGTQCSVQYLRFVGMHFCRSSPE